MRVALSSSSLLALALPATVSAVTWTLSDYYGPESFLSDDWVYFDDSDPTNGLVTYQSKENAVALNLSYINDNNEYVMRVDTTEVQLEGRPSVRIYSQKNYTDGVYILNATHMPSGCSVWPAWWTVTAEIQGWPVGGEIDIMENSNNQFPANLGALHTNDSCRVSAGNMTGTLVYDDCSLDTGCRIEMNGTNAVAETTSGYNSAGGGIYAMERSFGSTGKGIRMWYFDFDDIPDNLQGNVTSIDTDSWGLPAADWPVTSCRNQFDAHSIVFTTTLCGDWAGVTYNETSCGETYGACSFQVGYNGSSYEEAYWAVNSIKVFAAGGGTDAAAPAVNSDVPDAPNNSNNGGGGTSDAVKSAATSAMTLTLSAMVFIAACAVLL